ncbi:unnamed protein product [Prunus armeniaca]
MGRGNVVVCPDPEENRSAGGNLQYILVLPPYQHKGCGRYLLEVLNDVAISEYVYDLTVDEPLDYFEHVRTCVDVLRLHKFDPIKHAVSSAVSQLKQGKLSKKTHPPRLMPDTRVIEDDDLIGKDSGTGGKQVIEVPSIYEPEMSFVMFRSQAGEAASTVQIDENQPNQEEQLQQLVDERVKEIKSIAEKVSVELSIIAEAS